MADYELPGAFYLGREYDLRAAKAKPDYLLYESKDLVTHAVCVGMTGSGKTGLCLALLEEAAIDGIPAIIIDPKGDLGNLMLTFPNLQPSDFEPWIDPGEAKRKQQTPAEYSATVAATWKQGLADWDQPPERIQRFKDAVEISIYTPGSNAGIPLTVLRSFAAPPQAIRDNNDALRERVTSAVSGLLSLVGIEADPLQSREHILISNLIDRSWREGNDLDLNQLIREIQKPPFRQLGAFDIESFFPEKDRFGLSMALNNLLASPGFANWMQGESLDIQKLLYSDKGKPRFAIMSIAHLGDAERMFFVTILLNEMIAWMRSQSGTTSLRAILYMDEVFGYFPPVANPPSKQPMLTLLKQARAFGLGCVLATQNPVDLDYKGLSNAGTWFLGRLQTERDKARVLDGLEGASTAAGAAFDRKTLEKTLSGLGNRVFLMNNVHDDHPVVFQSRWALSFLRGPISTDQIRTLMQDKKAESDGQSKSQIDLGKLVVDSKVSANRPSLAPGIKEVFKKATTQDNKTIHYEPGILAIGKVHLTNASKSIDHWQNFALLLPMQKDGRLGQWDDAEDLSTYEETFSSLPASNATYGEVAPGASTTKQFKTFITEVKDYLYQSKCTNLSRFAISELEMNQIKTEHTEAVANLESKRDKKNNDLEVIESGSSDDKVGVVVKGVDALFGILSSVWARKKPTKKTMDKAQGSARAFGKVRGRSAKAESVSNEIDELDQKILELKEKYETVQDKIKSGTPPSTLFADSFLSVPKKTDIDVDEVVLAWIPN